jgi:hypothetical protein
MHLSQPSERFRKVRLAICDPARLTEVSTTARDTREANKPIPGLARDPRKPNADVSTLARDLEAAWVAIRSLRRLTLAALPFLTVAAMLATEILSNMPTGQQSCIRPHAHTEEQSE